MNNYMGDTRYEKVWEQMQLLGIEDVTSKRQARNGTRVWRLPIKNNHKPTSFIEVASFKTGYVRNQNSGYSNYQLNKRCQSEPHYYPEQKYIDGKHRKTGKYLKYETRGCKLIPIEIDRLEYLISYCLKNYFINRANQVVEGKYVSQWYHDWSMERANETYSENTGAMARINDMEEKLDDMTECRDLHVDTIIKLEEKLVDMNDRKIDLENKLATINRISEGYGKAE